MSVDAEREEEGSQNRLAGTLPSEAQQIDITNPELMECTTHNTKVLGQQIRMMFSSGYPSTFRNCHLISRHACMYMYGHCMHVWTHGHYEPGMNGHTAPALHSSLSAPSTVPISIMAYMPV